MCLITEQTKPELTTEAITVYKVINSSDDNSYQSLNGKTHYVKDKLVKAKLRIDNKMQKVADIIVPKAYKLDLANWAHGETCPKGLTHVHNGLHAALTLARLSTYQYGTLAEFEIPKGSLILKDKTGLIVSNKIIFRKILKKKIEWKN